jgi:hypothetical protein
MFEKFYSADFLMNLSVIAGCKDTKITSNKTINFIEKT